MRVHPPLLLALAFAVGVSPKALGQESSKVPASPGGEAEASAPAAALARRLDVALEELSAARNRRTENAGTLAPTLLAELDRRISLLERLDFLLTQQQLELDRASAAQQALAQAASDRVALTEASLDGVVALPELDALTDRSSAQRARARAAERASAAAAGAVEQARTALAEAERKRSRARAELDEGPDGAQAVLLESRLATARLAERVQRAELELRKAEAQALELEAEVQRERESLARERLERSRSRAVFTPAQLAERVAQLEARDRQLAERANEARAAQPEAERAWAQSRLRLAETEEPGITLVQAELAARLRLEELRKRERTAADARARAVLRRLAWERRQAVLSGAAEAAERAAWERETQAVIEELEGQEAVTESTLGELRQRRATAEAQVGELEAARSTPPAALARARAARASIEALVTLAEAELQGIEQTASLLEKLARDLEARDGGASWWSGAWAALCSAASRAWGFELGSLNERLVTLGGLVKGLVVLLLGLALLRLACTGAASFLKHRFGLEEGAASTLESIAFYFSAFLLGVLALHVANIPLTAFTLLGGALAIGIGFGTQNLMNNFISGLLLLVERPVRVGDLIEVRGGTKGVIRRIGARSTDVLTGEGVNILVPNSIFLENEVVNWTLGDNRVRTSVTVGFAYGSPTRDIARQLKEAADDHGRVLDSPEPFVLFSDFGDNALHFELHFWTRVSRPMDARKVQSDLRFMIDHRCREAGLVIAFPQRDVHLDAQRPLEVRLLAGSADEGAEAPAERRPRLPDPKA